jgi:uncharacterized membrane protein YagU involved in acid resistance
VALDLHFSSDIETKMEVRMRPSALQAIAGGFVATIAITAVMYWVAPLLLGSPMDIAKTLGDFLGIGWNAGMILHFINGSLIFPLVYAFVLFGMLPGGSVTKGVTFGVGLWLVAQTVVMPIVGAGFFSANAGGVMAAVASLIGHLIYGATLGAIAGEEHAVMAAA